MVIFDDVTLYDKSIVEYLIDCRSNIILLFFIVIFGVKIIYNYIFNALFIVY